MPQDCSSRDPVELLLRRIALGALLVSSTACADDELWSSKGGEALSADYDPCVDAPEFLPVRAAELRLAQPADYTAVRLKTDPTVLPETRTISEVGTACATATSNACTELLSAPPERLTGPSCVRDLCTPYELVTTRGDQVTRATTADQLKPVLGAIDSFDDALLLVQSASYNVSCPSRDSDQSADGAGARRVHEVAGGYELFASTLANDCPISYRRHQLFVSSSGEISTVDTRDFKSTGCAGRVPAGLVAVPRRDASLGAYLAHCAHLEAASVFAFERLAEELRALGAPATLIERAHAAARDEVRHAQVMAALARARGAEPTTPRLDEVPARSLEDIALENAVEGCVRETYGAVIGAYQAARAGDDELRFAMRSIARDEARHASLSHAVHTWLMPQLDAAARQRIEQAQRALIAQLRAEHDEGFMRASAGLPDRATANGMLDALERELWSQPLAV